MRLFHWMLLYTALALGANPAAAGRAQTIAAGGGDMKKLAFHETALAVPDIPFETAEGGSATLADHAGRYVLLNFWATWCAPCRKEMPMLSELQNAYGGDDFEVLTIATGRDDAAKVARFFDSMGITNLPRSRDGGQALARAMGVFGLPVVILLDPEGHEIARLTGPADWASSEARTLIAALTSAP